MKHKNNDLGSKANSPRYDCIRLTGESNLNSVVSRLNETQLDISNTVIKEHLIDGILAILWTGSGSLSKLLNSECPYCQHSLLTGRFFKEVQEDNGFSMTSVIEHCIRCNYWCCHISSFLPTPTIQPIFSINYLSFISKVREFNDKLPEGCVQEFSEWIRRKSHRWHTMNTTSFEKLVAEIFRANHKGSEVFHVGKPDDGGVDVIFIDSGDNQWLIQAKRRTKRNSSEGVSTVRNLIGTMYLENKLHGVVTSTADHFTYRAYQAAKRAKEKGMFIELFDRGKLDRMLDPIISPIPWFSALKPEHTEVANYFYDNCYSPTIWPVKSNDSNFQQLNLF